MKSSYHRITIHIIAFIVSANVRSNFVVATSGVEGDGYPAIRHDHDHNSKDETMKRSDKVALDAPLFNNTMSFVPTNNTLNVSHYDIIPFDDTSGSTNVSNVTPAPTVSPTYLGSTSHTGTPSPTLDSTISASGSSSSSGSSVSTITGSVKGSSPSPTPTPTLKSMENDNNSLSPSPTLLQTNALNKTGADVSSTNIPSALPSMLPSSSPTITQTTFNSTTFEDGNSTNTNSTMTNNTFVNSTFYYYYYEEAPTLSPTMHHNNHQGNHTNHTSPTHHHPHVHHPGKHYPTPSHPNIPTPTKPTAYTPTVHKPTHTTNTNEEHMKNTQEEKSGWFMADVKKLFLACVFAGMVVGLVSFLRYRRRYRLMQREIESSYGSSLYLGTELL